MAASQTPAVDAAAENMQQSHTRQESDDLGGKAAGAPIERRNGIGDRRRATADRRNEDRLAEEIVPRRNPEVPDRRSR